MVKDKKDAEDKVEFKDGVKYTWDKAGRCFVSCHMSNAPLPQWDEWNALCEQGFSGQRWQMVWADYLKARAYENLLLMLGGARGEEEPEAVKDGEGDDLGLLNPKIGDNDGTV